MPYIHTPDRPINKPVSADSLGLTNPEVLLTYDWGEPYLKVYTATKDIVELLVIKSYSP